MKTVAITGICGYVGNKLRSLMETRGDVEKIVGVDINAPGNSSPKLVFYRQDILDPLADIFIKNKVDAAIHLAFVLKPTHNQRRASHVDIGGAANFLSACRQAGVKHVLYLSSHTVYGAHPDNPVPLTEDCPPLPLRGFQYSWDKARSEDIFRDFASSHKDMCVTILRSCPVIGPNAGKTAVASMFTPVMIRVAGYDPLLQFVHEEDLADLMTLVITRAPRGIFNVAGSGEVRYSEAARLFRRRMLALPEPFLRSMLGILWAMRLQSQSPIAGLEFIKYPPVVSTEKLRKEVGFDFKHSSKEALLSFIRAYG